MIYEILEEINFFSSIFYQVLYMTVIGSIVGLIVYFIRNIFDKKISGKWKCIMWSVVLIALLVPMRLEIKTNRDIKQNEIINNFENIKYINQKLPETIEDETLEKVETIDNIEEDSFSQFNKVDKSENEKIVGNLENISNLDKLLNQMPLKHIILDIFIPYVWLIGGITFLVIYFIGNIKIKKRISKFVYKNPRIETILEECKQQLHIKKKVKIILQKYKKVPSIYGIFKPSILITENILQEDDETIKYIFLHELSHYKRKDNVLNYILLLVLSVHWFNPVVWFLFNKIRQDIEIGADELATKKLDNIEKKQYGMVLINLLRNRIQENYTASMLCMSDTGKNMERRILMIKGKSKSVILSFFIVTIVLGVVGGFVFVKVTNNEDVPNILNSKDYSKEIPEKVTEIGNLEINVDGGWKFSEGSAFIEGRSECIVIDKKGNEILELKDKDIRTNFSNGLAVCAKRVPSQGQFAEFKYGYVDKSGNVVIDYIYDYADSFVEGLAPVEKDGKYGYIDTNGNWVLDFNYSYEQFTKYYPPYFYEGLLWVRNDEGKYGCIDKTGNIVIDFKYDFGVQFSEGLACVGKNGKYGYIDKDENVIIDFEYDIPQPAFSEGLAGVSKDGKYKYIDKTGKTIIDNCPYEYIGEFSNGLAVVEKNDKRGYINKKGKLVIGIQYDGAAKFSEGLAYVSNNGDSAYINYDGDVIIGDVFLKAKQDIKDVQKNETPEKVEVSNNQKIIDYIDEICKETSGWLPEFKDINEVSKYWIYGHLEGKNSANNLEGIWEPFSTKEQIENDIKKLFGPDLIVDLEKDIEENEELLQRANNIMYNEKYNVYEFLPYGWDMSTYYAINSIKKNGNNYLVNVVEYCESGDLEEKYKDKELCVLIYSGDDARNKSFEGREEICVIEYEHSDSREDIKKKCDEEVLKRKEQFTSFNIILEESQDGNVYVKSVEKEIYPQK